MLNKIWSGIVILFFVLLGFQYGFESLFKAFISVWFQVIITIAVLTIFGYIVLFLIGKFNNKNDK